MKDNLIVSQRVFIELSNLVDTNFKKTLYEFEVVEADDCLAYLVEISSIKNNRIKNRYIVEQKTHDITAPYKTTIFKFTLWLSKEEYEAHEKYNNELSRLLKLAHEKLDKMSIEQLKDFVNN